MAGPIAAETSLTLPNEPEQLWPYVADTARLDRAVGLPAARFTRTERPEGGEEDEGEYRVLGLRVARWKEHPFEWERPRRFTVLREYRSGPLTRFYGGTELVRETGGTRVRVFAEFTPRNVLFDPLVRFYIAPQSMRRTRRQYESIATFLAGRGTTPFTALAGMRSPTDTTRLDTLVARLLSEDAPLAPTERLRRLLAEAPDEDVTAIRPLELADAWGTDRQETLDVFLRATLAGLLEVHWELLCPSCRGVKADATHLRDLTTTVECTACNVHHFAANLDELVEARFYVAPAIRRVDLGAYCVGGPMQTPHRIAQAALKAGVTREWQLALEPGPYVVRSPQSRGAARLAAERGDSPALLDVTVEVTAVRPAQACVGAGPAIFRLANETGYDTTVILESARWSDAAATPGRLMLFPAFRTLFSSEALAPGVMLSISRVGLLFTDIAGSTALYEQAGDARAFRLVGEHFTILHSAIEQAGGALVKTIGDAVMGAFPDGRSALAAAIAIQRDVRALDTGGYADPIRLVKVGVHAGACFAVTLNERLDYFGTAVNLTARAQHEARGGEIVATPAVLEEADDLVAGAGLAAEPFDILLKGFSMPVRLFRCDSTAVGTPSAAYGSDR